MPVWRSGVQQGLGGHASISDDGSGNVVIASGADIQLAADNQILCGVNSQSKPHLADANDSDNGIRCDAPGVQAIIAGGVAQDWRSGSTQLHYPAQFNGTLTKAPGTTQDLTADGTVVIASKAVVSLESSTGARLMTSAFPTGSDGQELVVRATGSNPITFQDESNLGTSNILGIGGRDVVLSPGDRVTFEYDSGLGAWVQLTPVLQGGAMVGPLWASAPSASSTYSLMNDGAISGTGSYFEAKSFISCPRAGSIVGIAASMSADLTTSANAQFFVQKSTDGGDTWADVWGDGTTGAVELDASTAPENAVATQRRGESEFAAGDLLRVRMTTDASAFWGSDHAMSYLEMEFD